MDSRKVKRLKLSIRHVAFHLFLPTLFLTSIFSSLAKAAPGDLDTTFGASGKVITAIGTVDDEVSALEIQSDGKLVAAGYSSDGTTRDFALARYNTDGTLDTTFNTTGIVTTSIGNTDDYGFALAIQSDKKLVVAGSSNNGDKYVFTLLRYNTDGTLDTTFNTTGIVTTSIGSIADEALALAVQSDGKLVAAGSSNSGTRDFALVRYNTDGTLDTTFNVTGIVTTPIGIDDEIYALAIQSDGKLVAAGHSNYDFTLARYNTNGTLDTTFNATGIVTTPIGITDGANSLVIQPDGKLVAAGLSYNGSRNVSVMIRYNTDGSLDTTFNTTGFVITPIGADNATNGLAIQSNGKLLAAGRSYNGTQNVFALVRYNTDGSLDTTFGTDGIVNTAIQSQNDAANVVVIQSDGKSVAAGFSYNGSQYEFALARYMNGPTPPTRGNCNDKNKGKGKDKGKGNDKGRCIGHDK